MFYVMVAKLTLNRCNYNNFVVIQFGLTLETRKSGFTPDDKV